LALADAGQLTLERTSTDLSDLLKRVVERFQSQAVNRNVSLQLEPIIGSHSLTLLVDPQRIEQILANLLSNALRHTPEGGRIIVTIVPITGTFVETADLGYNEVQISVHDSGPGISPEAIPHVFERFYRADRSRSRSEGGSGLGLAIARQLAEAHGGGLTVANHPQGGAVFTLTLPNKR
jgi:signal transduction histidine kinase